MSMSANQLDVVVLPWVPATASVGRFRVMAPKSSARFRAWMPRDSK